VEIRIALIREQRIGVISLNIKFHALSVANLTPRA